MTYIRVCTRYKTDTHEIHLTSIKRKQKRDPSWNDIYEQTVNFSSIKTIRCHGKSATRNYNIVDCCDDNDDTKICNYLFYICWEKNMKSWFLIHPESFPIIERLLDPNYNPFESIEIMLDNWIKYNPLSGSIIKIVKEDFEKNIHNNNKRKLSFYLWLFNKSIIDLAKSPLF